MVTTYRPNYLVTYVIYDELDHITKLETIHMITGRLAASYEYIYNEEGYIVKEIVKETIVSQWFEEIYDLFLDTILGHIDIDKYDRIMEEWKKFYDSHHIFCDHGDADEDGQYDNCLWSYMTATSTYDYRYDENWQLTKCTERLQNGITTEYDYQYDKDGNRSKYVKTVNGEWTECYTYEYNAANQLVSRTNERLWTDNVTHYTYDADGNLISEQTGLFEKSYEYTAENRLAVVKAQGTVLMAALYDGDGNRLFTMDYTGENNDRWDIWIPECGGNADKVDDSARDAMKELAGLVSWRERRDYTITEYVNDITRENEEVLAELNPRGKVTTAYTYGYNRESADVNGDTQYYLNDGQGNVGRISSEWGRVKETYSYDPYGNLTYGIPDTVNYYGYNGESSNLATGLQYLRARYYNPQTGSFITEDTYTGQISNPLTLNRYDYVSNNPVNYIDPSGHSGIGKFLSDAWNGVTGFIEDVGNTIGEGFNALGDAYMQGQQMIQQTQRMEEQAILDWITGKNGGNSPNKLQEALEGKKSQTKQEPEEKDKNILEQIGEGTEDALKFCGNVYVQYNQAELEHQEMMCSFYQTEYGQATAKNQLAVALNLTGFALGTGKGVVPLIFATVGSISGIIDGGSKPAGSTEEFIYNTSESMVKEMYYWETLGVIEVMAPGTLSNPANGVMLKGTSETVLDTLYAFMNNGSVGIDTIGWMLLINTISNGDLSIKQIEDILSNSKGMKYIGDILEKIKHSLKGGRKTSEQWYKSTFDTVEDSMEYHLRIHGKGRTIEEYTQSAMDFYNQNKHLGEDVILKDGSEGIKIQTGTGKNKVGGFWTKDGKLVTFWD